MANLPISSIGPASAGQDVAASRAYSATRISSAAQEFESVLLGQWLQAAESSFGSAPGGQDDADAGGEQVQGFAVQQLAGRLAGSGGIGIAKLVQNALAKFSAEPSARHDNSIPRSVQTSSDWISQSRRTANGY